MPAAAGWSLSNNSPESPSPQEVLESVGSFAITGCDGLTESHATSEPMKIKCPQCKQWCEKPPNEINRARKAALRIFCGRRCAGLARRTHKTKTQRVAEKQLYDLEYRRKNLTELKAKKAAYHKRAYDPVKAAIERKKRMAFHVEYCRRPSYKLWKREYDRRRRDGEYGAFAEAARLTIDLNREIKERATSEQIKQQSGTANKVQSRRRADKAPERTRPRYRDRRDRHTTPYGP